VVPGTAAKRFSSPLGLADYPQSSSRGGPSMKIESIKWMMGIQRLWIPLTWAVRIPVIWSSLWFHWYFLSCKPGSKVWSLRMARKALQSPKVRKAQRITLASFSLLRISHLRQSPKGGRMSKPTLLAGGRKAGCGVRGYD
jgi:hypothetical protein